MKQRIIKTFILILVIMSFVLVLTSCSSSTSSKITMTFDSSSCLERNYEEIKDKLEKIGFTNIKIEEQGKGIFFARQSGNVSFISIAGRQKWSINDLFNPSDMVVIKYWH